MDPALADVPIADPAQVEPLAGAVRHRDRHPGLVGIYPRHHRDHAVAAILMTIVAGERETGADTELRLDLSEHPGFTVPILLKVQIVHYGRDTKGWVTLVETKASGSVGAWTMVADTFAYEPFAAVKALRFGNGLSVANDWGNDGWLTSRRFYRRAAALISRRFQVVADTRRSPKATS